MYPDHPVPPYHVVAVDVHNDPWAEYIPGNLYPGTPPAWVIAPPIGGSINAVLPVQDVLYRSPVIYVDIITVIRVVSPTAIGVPFHRFNNYFFTVEVFVSYDLEHGISPPDDLQFDNGDILYIVAVDQCLQDNGVKISLPPVFNADVIRSAVIVQIQVVHPVLSGIKFSLKIP
jgi:hypothetical protein